MSESTLIEELGQVGNGESGEESRSLLKLKYDGFLNPV